MIYGARGYGAKKLEGVRKDMVLRMKATNSLGSGYWRNYLKTKQSLPPRTPSRQKGAEIAGYMPLMLPTLLLLHPSSQGF